LPGVPDDAPTVLFAGQIGLRKGLDTWLEAAARIARPRPDVHFLIAGSRHSQKEESIALEATMRARSASGILAGRVHWLGWRDDLPALMNRATVLLHTARQEPLGRVLLEAFASGLPAVATRVGGTPEIFCDPEIERLMVPVDDAEAAAREVLRLMGDPAWHTNVSDRERGIAAARFSVHQAAERLVEVYTGTHADSRADSGTSTHFGVGETASGAPAP
jgi:glycosyltransferase involved in cell wall biosynthesis